LMKRAGEDGVAALVAHGYFNLIIGRELSRRGFKKSGSHRARFWNAVVYTQEPEKESRKSRKKKRAGL
jgi:hypothetical protein